MELFVINRHGEEKSEITAEKEKEKLERVLKQIERKKQQRIRQREREREKQRILKVPEFSEELEEEVQQNEKRTKFAEDETDEFRDDPVIPEKKKKAKKSKLKSLDLESFTIIGAENIGKKYKAKRVLPYWLANPTVISSNLQDLTLKVSKIKLLDQSILKQLKANGIKYFFPVQAEVIPFLLKSYEIRDIMIPRDVCVSAPTGSGKTLAFVLPVIQALKGKRTGKIRALAILPTQDLAEQVFKCFKTYIQGTNLKVGLITGKHPFSDEQRQLLSFSELFGYISRIDILVCTAGRLVSHLKSTIGFDLKWLEFLIIDEADRVLESVQDDWLYHLDKHFSAEQITQTKELNSWCSLQKPKAPQKLLFSATLTQDPEKLERLSLFQPKLFSSIATREEMEEDLERFVGKYSTPLELTEKYIVCSKDLKPLVLYNFIKSEDLARIIVFTHSVESAHRLKILLQCLFKSNFKVEEMSSSLKGKNRDELIVNFANGDIDILICTDFLARGIDLPGVDCVISYSAPKYLKTYIHRVGRTARAGEPGLAVTLLHTEQVPAFKSLLGQLKKNIEEVKVDETDLESLSKRYKKALNKLKEAIMKEEKTIKNNIISMKKSLKVIKAKRKVMEVEKHQHTNIINRNRKSAGEQKKKNLKGSDINKNT